MKRQTFDAKIGEHARRLRTVIEDDPSVAESDDSRMRARQFLRSMLDDSPELLRCGLHEFKKLRMWHDGQRWVIETEAEIQEAIPDAEVER